MSSKFKWKVYGDGGKLLFGRRENNNMIFVRRQDMNEDEKNIILSIYAYSKGIPEDEHMFKNKEIQEMVDFLNFKETDGGNEFCG